MKGGLGFIGSLGVHDGHEPRSSLHSCLLHVTGSHSALNEEPQSESE